MIDDFDGVIVTLTTTGNTQTLVSPTAPSPVNKRYTVANDSTSTDPLYVE